MCNLDVIFANNFDGIWSVLSTRAYTFRGSEEQRCRLPKLQCAQKLCGGDTRLETKGKGEGEPRSIKIKIKRLGIKRLGIPKSGMRPCS